MPLFVNTNVSSLNAQRQLMQSGQELEKASTRLASGRRINTAADDAAGLAIANRQTSTIRGLDQAVRNANDGISLIQTAEGALGETTNILQRMRELSIQSANGIYEDKDRATLDAEVQQLIQELDRIAASTAFNGQQILNGSLKNVDLQVGAQANQTISFGIQAVDAQTLGMGSLTADMVSAEIGGTSQQALDEQDILINGQAVGAIESTDTINDITAQISENINGVTASAVVQMDATSVGTGVIGTGGMQFAVVGGDGLTTTWNVANTESLQDLADQITAATGGILSGSLGADGSLQVAAKDARSVTVTDADAGSGLLTATAINARIVLSSDNGDPISIQRGATGSLMKLDAFGFRETLSDGTIRGVGLIRDGIAAYEPMKVGDLTINGVQISATDTSGLTAKIDAINAVSNETGVLAGRYTQVVVNMSGFVSSSSDVTDMLRINGVSLDLALNVSAQTSEIAAALNNNFALTGVQAKVLGTNLILESFSGGISLLGASTAANSFFSSSSGVTSVMQTLSDPDTVRIGERTTTINSSVTAAVEMLDGLELRSLNGSPIAIEFGENSTAIEIQTRLGIRESNTLGQGSFGSAVASISVDTQTNAQKAISVIDNALETVNDIRSDLGAASNRLGFTISNLGNVSENTSAARSRIVDADFAAETAALSRAQVLQQASQAMLSQANARPQQVLSLLQ